MSERSYLETVRRKVAEYLCKSEEPRSHRSILFVTSYYNGFLNQIYRDVPNLHEQSFTVQHAVLMNSFFGDSDFYSQGMRLCGWAADDIVYNCEPLQQKWAEEHDCGELSLREILVAQIRTIRPDVLYLHCFELAVPGFFDEVKPYVKRIVGQIASPVPANCDPKLFDLIFTSFPHFAERFRNAGIESVYQPLGFDRRVLEALEPHRIERDVPVSFVGGISSLHRNGISLLEQIATATPVHIWGYGAGSLPDSSVLKQNHHGEVWGIDMFATLARSKITLNRHIDVAENFANNMRLFEATGCGALLITDMKDNLADLFEIGTEIVAYSSPEDAVAKIRYYREHPDEAARIAKAGQERTLRDHSYENRMKQTAEILEQLLGIIH